MARRLFLLALIAGALAHPASQAVAAPPQIEATYVTGVTATSANLRAEIDPKGLATTYRFEYLTLSAYEANVKAAKEPFSGALKAPPGGSASAGSGSAAVLVTQHLSSLKAATLYRFRAIATNAGGTTTGPERPFGTQEPTNAFALLDNRGWEMVSPVDKNGGEIQAPEAIFGGGAFQASSDGQSLTYSSADSFAGGAGAPPGSQYLATRTGAGWATANITAPLEAGGYGDQPDGVPYRLFSTDLARALLQDPRRCAEGNPCPRSYSLRGGSGAELASTPEQLGLVFEGASEDLHHFVFASPTGLFGWSGAGGLSQLTATATAALAAPSGAISADGSRTYFTAAGDLYLRQGAQTKQVDQAQGGGGAFQVASTDGRYAFFIKAEHLYRWDANTEVATDLTPAGTVQGVLGASADGTHAYYANASGLFLWSAGTTEVAPGPAALSSYPPATGTARVSPDGTHLLFLSTAELTGYEADGARETFLYGPPPAGGQPRLTCISCNPTGERPEGSASIPTAIANGTTQAYKPRALSANGQRAFFESADDLSPQDSNNATDVYQWEAQGEGSCAKEGGCVQLISSGRAEGAARFIDASADASDAFFLTDASLAFGDPGSYDLYDARVNGGFPDPPNTIACEGDACQPLPEAPDDPPVGTLVANGGNPARRFARVKDAKGQKPKKKGKHKKKHGKAKHRKQGGRK